MHDSPTSDRIPDLHTQALGIPELTRMKRDLKKKERGDRHTKRRKYDRRLEHANPVGRSARLSMKGSSKGSPSPNPTESSLSSVSGGLEPIAADVVDAQPRMQVDGTRVPTHGQGEQLLTQQQVPIQSLRPPIDPFPFPEDIDISFCNPELKREGPDWFVLFNSSPKVKRMLDVNVVHTLTHESPVTCVKFSQDGKQLATGSNWFARIYDVETGVEICVLDHGRNSANDMYIRSVCFSPDGKYFATGAEDAQIRVWISHQIHNIFKGHQSEVCSLQFSAKGRFIVSGSADQTLRIWDMHDRTSKIIITDGHYFPLEFKYAMTCVAISPNEKYVAVSRDAVVNILEITTGAVVQRLRGHEGNVFGVAFTPNGKGLLSASLDRTLRHWDISGLGIGLGTGTLSIPSPCLMSLAGHKDYVLCLAVSPDGTWVVSGSKDRNVLFWDMKTGVTQCLLSGHQHSVIHVDLCPVSNLLATAGGDGQARIWSYGVTGEGY